MTSSLRHSARLQLSDHVVLSLYRAPIEEAKEIVLEQEESAEAPAEREALRFYLRDELRISPIDPIDISATSEIPFYWDAA